MALPTVIGNLQRVKVDSPEAIPLREYWHLLRKYLRPQIAWVGLLAVLLFGGTGMQLVSPQIMRRFVDGSGDANVPLDDVLALALLFVGVALAQQILGVLSTYAGQRVSWSATNAVREDLTLHCLQLDMPFHTNRTPGEMIERIDGDVSSLASFFSQFAVRILFVHRPWRQHLPGDTQPLDRTVERKELTVE